MAYTTAMILAAGLGTRMRPLTERMPKPMVPVVGKPLVDYAVEFFRGQGVQRLVCNSSYLAEQLEAHLQHAFQDIAISREDSPLETGGGIAKALPLLGDAPFYCLNSDVIVVDPKGDLLARMQAALTPEVHCVLAVFPREQAIGFDGAGDFFLEDGGRLRRRGNAPQADYVFSGLQLLRPEFFAHAPQGAFSMNVLYNAGMDAHGLLAPTVRAVVHAGDWLHVGDLPGLDAATRYFSN